MDLLGALDVGHRAVDRGAADGRVMADGDHVVAVKRLERLENDHPVIEMIRTGEGVLVAENEPHWASGADLVGDPVQGALQPAKTILRNQKFRRFLFSPQNIGASLQGKAHGS